MTPGERKKTRQHQPAGAAITCVLRPLPMKAEGAEKAAAEPARARTAVERSMVAWMSAVERCQRKEYGRGKRFSSYSILQLEKLIRFSFITTPPSTTVHGKRHY